MEGYGELDGVVSIIVYDIWTNYEQNMNILWICYECIVNMLWNYFMASENIWFYTIIFEHNMNKLWTNCEQILSEIFMT